MEDVSLEMTVREELGTRASRRHRAAGIVPCILYGLGKDSVSLSAPRNSLEAVLRTGKRMVDLNVAGDTEAAIVKELQFHPVTDNVIHVDFERVAMDEEITIQVAIVLKGRAKGLDEHGVMDHVMHEVEVTCLPRNIPDELILDVTDLAIGDSHHVSDLRVPDGVTVVAGADEIVAVVHLPAAEEEEVPAQEEAVSAQPEVITAAAEKEEEGEAAEGAPAKKD